MKRLFKIVMSLMLALAVVPSFAFAQDDTDILGYEDVEEDVNFSFDSDSSSVSSRSSLVTDSGSDTKSDSSVAKVETTTDESTTTLYYNSLADAFSASLDGDTVTLLKDITLTSYCKITKSIIFDLGGYTITAEISTSYAFAIGNNDGNITIQNGTIKNSYRGLYAYHVDLSIMDLTINCKNNIGIYIYEAKVNMESSNISGGSYGVQISSPDSDSKYKSQFIMNSGYVYGMASGIMNFGQYNAEPSSDSIKTYLEINGGTVQGGTYGITGNGGYRNTETVINDGEIYGGVEGIYHPHWGILTISDGSITGGKTGLEMRAGILTITGGTIASEQDYLYVYANDGGPCVYGVALAISQHKEDYNLEVTISGGTFKGVYALYEQDFLDDLSENEEYNVTISITGGTFISTGTSTTDYSEIENENYPDYKYASILYQSIYSENCTGFVSGGTFLSEVTYDNNISLTTYDLDPSYVSSSSITVYVDDNDTTYTGTVLEIQNILNDLYDEEVIGVGSIVTVYVVGDDVDSVSLSDLSCVKIVNLTDDTVTINGLKATSTGITTHPYAVYYEEVEATCLEGGTSAYYYCSICDHYFEDKDCQIETTVTYSDATGHNWDYDNIEWVWSEDYTSATGTIYCLNNSEHILTVDATITSEVTKEATTESTGTITYTATITDEDGNVYTDTKIVETDKLNAVVEADSDDDTTDDGDNGSTTTTAAAASSETEESAETDTSDSYSIMLYTVVGLASLASMYGIKAYRKREEN